MFLVATAMIAATGDLPRIQGTKLAAGEACFSVLRNGASIGQTWQRISAALADGRPAWDIVIHQRVPAIHFDMRDHFVVLRSDLSPVIEALPGKLHRRLNERAIDLMIVALLPKLDIRALAQERLWEERLVIALPRAHDFATKAALRWDDIAELPVILKDSHIELVAYRTLLDRIDRKVHLEQHDVSCSALLDMVGLGMGATIVFSSSAVPHRGVAFVPIDEADATIGVDAVWPKDDRNPLRHRLLSLVRDHKEDLSTGVAAATAPPTAPTPDRG